MNTTRNSASGGRSEAEILAHNLNNSLAAILGYTWITRQHPISPEAEVPLVRIETEVDRMKTRIQGFLVAPAGRGLQSVAWPAFWATCIAGLAAACARHAIRFDDRADFCGTLDLDPESMRQVFENVVSNAIRAILLRESNRTEKDPAAISVQTTHSTSRLTIAITDNGTGMTDEKLEHLFTGLGPEQILGHGIGLPWCKHVVVLHGGATRVRSVLGKGTTVFIELPIVDEPMQGHCCAA